MITDELLKTGKHTVTALTRPSSKSTVPSGAKTVKLDYENPSTDEELVTALKGQQFLIITLPAQAPNADQTHTRLVRAAVKAGVRYVMPNVFGADYMDEEFGKENLFASMAAKRTAEVQREGAISISMVCGFWIEWSMALGPLTFGFDFNDKTVTFYDDGMTRIDTSTWAQCGRAAAQLLSLPLHRSGAANGGPCLADWDNKPLYINSFLVSQREMLDSVLRVTGGKESDWTIKHEPSKERYTQAMKDLQTGDQLAFPKAMYARTFYKSGGGDYGSTRGLANQKLGLPKENLDDVMEEVIRMTKDHSWNPFAQH